MKKTINILSILGLLSLVGSHFLDFAPELGLDENEIKMWTKVIGLISAISVYLNNQTLIEKKAEETTNSIKRMFNSNNKE